MKRSKFSDTQIVSILKQAEAGMPVKEVCREHHSLSIRKACASIGLSRSAWYRPLIDWLERDRPVAEALSALADSKPGLGFWKLFGRLRRMGHNWNHKRV